MMLILGGVVVFAIVAIVVLVALLAGLGALSDRLRGVQAHGQTLRRRGVPVPLVDGITLELQQAGGTGVMFALIFLVFGVPVLALGWNELGPHQALEEQALYLAPGLAMLALAFALVVVGRARLVQSATYLAVVQRAPDVVELVPTAIFMWVNNPNALVNAMGMREKVWTPLAHVILRYSNGADHTLRAFHDSDPAPTVAALRGLMPAAAIAPYRPAVATAPGTY